MANELFLLNLLLSAVAKETAYGFMVVNADYYFLMFR